ncbi:hypothetical protein A5789_27785 [Nocardia sp. 852002-51101_SCH5132738]|uniref:hypothetical protein n=1 Tax=Nocardia sp. 852002-51101_SCH5132738 TaxID=1834095 RepID=UPI0007EA96BE|nr:hypothetical protein [Nocardia sp. 852002-51101_SCH5132738]OBA51491.1 hypothetical protein A5789_27785 [Nocardia sp. 852002-51101_SCH5132738]
MALITITADLPGDATTRVSADQVSAHFALAPHLLVLDSGEVVYGENQPFLLIHIPSGRPVVASGPGIDLRRLAVLLEDLPIDWNLPDPVESACPHFGEIREALALAADDHTVTVTV